MTYKKLPKAGTLTLPKLTWMPTPAHSSRGGVAIEDVFLHRWGGGTLPGVESEFKNPANQASSTFVYAGEVGPFRGQCVQMVKLADKAWTEAAFNAEGVSIECADAIWLGHDPIGFARVARITGWLCKHLGLPPVWVRDPHTHAKGVCRHADGGQDGGGHTACPTTDIHLWEQFIYRVKAEVKADGYRKAWAL